MYTHATIASDGRGWEWPATTHRRITWHQGESFSRIVAILGGSAGDDFPQKSPPASLVHNVGGLTYRHSVTTVLTGECDANAA
jgi:hypothetical protein